MGQRRSAGPPLRRTLPAPARIRPVVVLFSVRTGGRPPVCGKEGLRGRADGCQWCLDTGFAVMMRMTPVALSAENNRTGEKPQRNQKKSAEINKGLRNAGAGGN